MWHDLLERLEGAKADPEYETREPQAKTWAERPRRAQLEDMMKDEWSPYYSGKNAKELQAEYRAILEREETPDSGNSGGWSGEAKAAQPSTPAPQQTVWNLDDIEFPERDYRGGRY